MAVVVAGLQVLGDVGERAEILGVLSSAGNVPDLVLSNDVLQETTTASPVWGWQTHPAKGAVTSVCWGQGAHQALAGKGFSQPDQRQLFPLVGINGNGVPKQPAGQAFGVQVTVTTLVLPHGPGSSAGPAEASGGTRCDLRQAALQALPLQAPALRRFKLTLLEASMNFTPL